MGVGIAVTVGILRPSNAGPTSVRPLKINSEEISRPSRGSEPRKNIPGEVIPAELCSGNTPNARRTLRARYVGTFLPAGRLSKFLMVPK